MLDKDFIKRKITLIEEELMHLVEFENMTLENITKDYRSQALVERYLERLITRAIDINRHIIAEAGPQLTSPKKYRESFLALADLGVYAAEFAERIAPSAGFRNALVHEYNNIDKEILQKSIGEAIKDFNQYCKYVLEFLDKHK